MPPAWAVGIAAAAAAVASVAAAAASVAAAAAAAVAIHDGRLHAVAAADAVARLRE